MLDLIKPVPTVATDADRQAVLDGMRMPFTLRDFMDSLANAYAGGREAAERKPPFTGDHIALLADCHRLEGKNVGLQAENERLQLECEQLKTYVPYRKALQEVDRLKSLIAGDTSEIVKYRTDELERLEAKLKELRCKNAQRNAEILRLQAENERLQAAVDRLSVYNEKLVAKSKLVPGPGSIVFTPTGEVRRAMEGEWSGVEDLWFFPGPSLAPFPVYTRHVIPAAELPRGKPLPMETSDA
jgi:hypothetical protein